MRSRAPSSPSNLPILKLMTPRLAPHLHIGFGHKKWRTVMGVPPLTQVPYL